MTNISDNTLGRSPEKFGDFASTINARTLPDGEVIAGRYRIDSLIGQGAMGSVYGVEQLFLHKRFALKVLNKVSASELMVRRFRNEAQLTSRLDHPNLVRAVDFGLHDNNQPFMVMDFVEGPTLAEVLKTKGRMPVDSTLQIFIPILFAVSYAHQEGIVHRDIKPGNIILSTAPDSDAEFIPKIVDFGISKVAYTDQGHTLTQTGEVFGTPLYMSPEQCSGEKLDGRSDIYALGCVMYETLTGTPPFMGQNALETMMHHKTTDVPAMQEASLGERFPAALERIIMRMLAKDVNKRYQNCLEVAADLAKLESQKSHEQPASTRSTDAGNSDKQLAETTVFTLSKKKKPSLILLALALVGIICGGIFWFSTQPRNDATAVPSAPIPVQASTPLIPSSTMSFFNEGYDDKNVMFNFPVRIGEIYSWHDAAMTAPAHQDAAGEVTVSKRAIRILQPDLAVITQPSMSQRISQQDFDGIMLLAPGAPHADNDENPWYRKLLCQSQAKVLALTNCPLNHEVFDCFDSLHLRWLYTHNSLTVKQVEHASNTDSLRVLRLSGPFANEKLNPLLGKLSTSTPQLQRLGLDACGLAGSDIQLLSAYRNLTHLDLRQNFTSGLSNEERINIWHHMAKLPKLRALSVPANLIAAPGKAIDANVSQTLRSMSKLETLYVDLNGYDVSILQEVRNLLGATQVATLDSAKVDGWFDIRQTNPYKEHLW